MYKDGVAYFGIQTCRYQLGGKIAALTLTISLLVNICYIKGLLKSDCVPI